MQRVFLSYRRDDAAWEARALKLFLQHRLQSVDVYLDVDVAPGTVWGERIREELARTAALIALAGPRWSGGTSNRFADPDDWVRQEVETALANPDTSVLPVFVGNDPPNFDGLPTELRALESLQAVFLTPDRWDVAAMDIARWLVRELDVDEAGLNTGYPRPSEIKKLTSEPLSEKAIDDALKSGSVDGWSVRPVVAPQSDRTDSRELYKSFKFKNFERAFAFMERVAIEAERREHHPEWRNVWSLVEVQQSTWDAGNVITTFDILMAAFMNQAAAAVNNAEVSPWTAR